MNETNLNRLGRKPVFTRYTGFQMLENRKLFGEDRLTVDQFIEQMVIAGELKEPCARATMHRLLSGQMFPDLHTFTKDGTETEELYDYAKIPMCPSGRAPKPDREEVLASIKPRLTKGQQKLVDEIKRQTEAHMATQLQLMMQRFFAAMTERQDETDQKLGEFISQVAQLREEVRALKPNLLGPAPAGY
jgi:hypothetical protein